ncbi:MAG TPA: hypothetical protein VFC21_02500, partial [Bryobacteraceae bacterium]|nr:hypothetical protein [Bryobacteraceae bacterium]
PSLRSRCPCEEDGGDCGTTDRCATDTERNHQDAAKQTEGPVGERYSKLRELVREQTVIHTDDTGRRVGGASAYLMAFVNRGAAEMSEPSDP